MKRLFAVIFTIVIASLMFIGCSEKKPVQFNQFYSEVIGFSDTDEKSKSVPQDAILMINLEEFQSFQDKYFTPRGIMTEPPNKEKAVLYLQIPSPTSSVNRYIIKSMYVKDNTLIVEVEGTSVSLVDGIDGFDGKWKWVMFAEVDKKDLKKDMKIVLKR